MSKNKRFIFASNERKPMYNLSELDVDIMVIHPASSHLNKWMEKNVPNIVNDFAFTKTMSKGNIYRYILLMYDPNSPIQAMHSLDWFGKKYEACAYAGFELKKRKDGQNRFEEEVLNMILGKEPKINDMIIAFIAYLNRPQWDYIVFLRESMLSFTQDALGNKTTDYKNATDYKKLYDDYMRITKEMANRTEETDEFVSRFYYQIEQSRLAIRPEDYAKALEGGDDLRMDNPYGVNYVADRPRFVGEFIPE